MIDTKPDPRKPTLCEVIEANLLAARTGYSAPLIWSRALMLIGLLAFVY
jgi:hypothetical protein